MVTQAQIAQKLGVSRQLVTFALAGNTKMVSDKTRERILAAATSMGYRPNPHARALKMQRTGIIALWIPNLVSSHFARVAREFGRVVKQANYDLVISEVGDRDMQQMLSHVPVDGICVVDKPEAVQMQFNTFKARAIPVVSAGGYFSRKTDCVQVDLLAGTLDAMEHLIGSGYRRILHVTSVRESLPSESRRLGYLRTLRKASLKPEFAYYPSPQTDQMLPFIRQMIKDHIRDHGTPEAVFCHSDDAALGVYRGLCDLGLRVPKDVALVGCDGTSHMEYLPCSLTTIAQPVPLMCATAWQFLQQRIEQPSHPLQHAVLKSSLEIRESSKRMAVIS